MRFGESWDWWGPTRWEPTGVHPYDVRGGRWPGQTHRYADDEDVIWTPPQPSPAEKCHQGDADTCAACDPPGRRILASEGLTFSAAGRESLPSPKKRLRKDAYRRSRLRRLQLRRRAPDRGNLLSQRESARLVKSRERVALCGHYGITLQRRLPAAGIHAETCVVTMACGLRTCPKCFRRARAHARYRMEGPYRQFVTFGLSRKGISKLHAWRNMSKWVGELMKRLSREADKGIWQCYAEHHKKRKAHEIVNTNGKPLDYAWVIEPHKSEWPHVHVAWSAEYVCYNWIREQWNEITGQEIRWSKTKKVYTIDGVCRYMTDYMTKSVYPEYILAVLYRRRLWASTVRKRSKWEQGFTCLRILTPRDARVALGGSRAKSLVSSMYAGVSTTQWSFVERASGICIRWAYSEPTGLAEDRTVPLSPTHLTSESLRLIWDRLREEYQAELRAEARAEVHRPAKERDGPKVTVD